MTPDTDTVHVWLIGTDLPEPVLARLAALLDDGERARADALDLSRHRRRFVAAHGATRLVLGELLGVPAGRVRWRRGRHGKPELAHPAGHRVNLSHSGDLAMLAVTGHREVGVDLQRLPAGVDATRMAARFYPPDEARWVLAAAGPAERACRFRVLWARKEACGKAAGGRLLQSLALPVQGAGPVAVRDPDGGLPGAYLVRDLPAPPGFSAAVALEGTAPYRVVRHRWDGPSDPDPDPDTMAVQTCSTVPST